MEVMAVAVHPVTAAERARRTRVYEEALASVRLEGFELDEQVKGLYRRYISGELTLAAVGSAIDELDDREFGPIRRQWRRFQMISILPERDQKAVVRLVSSLVAAGALRKNGSLGEHNGR